MTEYRLMDIGHGREAHPNRLLSMGNDLKTTRRHPYGKGAEHLSTETLVNRGRRYRGGQSYKRVAAQLQQLANIQHNNKFRLAAERARKLAHEHNEYKENRERA